MKRLVALIGVLGATAGAFAGLSGPVRHAEDRTLDARFTVRGERPVDGLAVVAIDEHTFNTLTPEWPFRRRLHARMIDRLREAGARQIVYDVQFTEPSARPQDDLELYDAVAAAGHVILATGESDGRGGTQVLGGEEQLERAGRARAAASTFPSDAEGVIRRYARADHGLLTIAAAVAERLDAPAGMRAPALIDFRGPAGTVPTYSFADVLDGQVPAERLRGKIVVVGATAPVLQDVHPTSAPGGGQLAGPEVQANAIWTALHGDPLRPVPAWAGWLLVAGLGLVAPFAVAGLGPVRGTFAALALASLGAAGAQLLFDAGVVVPVAAPLLAFACGLATAVLAGAAAEIAAHARATRYGEALERAVVERTAELADTQLDVVRRLAQAAELRDDDTGEHIERMSRLCGEVAAQLGFSPARAELIRHASVLHDVGKIGVPDGILRKPGRLTEAEMIVMRRHVLDGARLIAGSDSDLLRTAELIVRTHHERWDGTGYPAGLRGEAIPIEGRIAAVCDVYDALVNERPYKHAWSQEAALEEIASLRGTHFDPKVADALLRVLGAPAAELRSSRPGAAVA